MNILRYAVLGCAIGALGACSAKVSPGAVANADGTYAVTEYGVTRNLPAPDGTVTDPSLKLQFWNVGNDRGYVYSSPDVVAIAIMDRTTQTSTAGITGTPAATVPTSGSATYNGAFTVTYNRTIPVHEVRNARGSFAASIDFGTSAVTGSGFGSYNSSLAINGMLSGTTISNGTATFSALGYVGGQTAPMRGGLYTNGTLAGVFQRPHATGLFWGQ